MEWLRNILLLAAGYFVGAASMSWPTTQIGCAVFCSFPLIRRLRSYSDCFDLSRCRRFFATSVVINAVILILVIGAVTSWAPAYMTIGFWVGYGLTFLLGLGQMGINENNVRDFVRILGKYIRPGKDEQAVAAMVEVIRW